MGGPVSTATNGLLAIRRNGDVVDFFLLAEIRAIFIHDFFGDFQIPQKEVKGVAWFCTKTKTVPADGKPSIRRNCQRTQVSVSCLKMGFLLASSNIPEAKAIAVTGQYLLSVRREGSRTDFEFMSFDELNFLTALEIYNMKRVLPSIVAILLASGENADLNVSS